MKNKQYILGLCFTAFLFLMMSSFVHAQETSTKTFDSADLAEYIKWFPAIKQVEMRDAWLKEYKMGEWQFTGSVTAKDKTVVTPQAGTNYGYT